jgi:hypothetical protein
MMDEEKPAGGMHGALIACLVVLLGLLIVTAFGAFLTLLLLDSPSRGALAEASRWFLAATLWLAPLVTLWSIWQNVQQLRGVKPARFTTILLPPAITIGLVVVSFLVSMVGWKA